MTLKLPFAEKYASRNPVSRYLIARFIAALSNLVDRAAPRKILEVGCGEGFLALALARRGYNVCGIDIREDAVAFAARRAMETGLKSKARFEVGDLRELPRDAQSADLLVCCEVLEHLDSPWEALCSLSRLPAERAVFSVPREPLWRFLNLCRLKYVGTLGNTPGHVNHWNKKSFLEFISTRYTIEKDLSPIPWTMVLCGGKNV